MAAIYDPVIKRFDYIWDKIPYVTVKVDCSYLQGVDIHAILHDHLYVATSKKTGGVDKFDEVRTCQDVCEMN